MGLLESGVANIRGPGFLNLATPDGYDLATHDSKIYWFSSCFLVFFNFDCIGLLVLTD